MKKCVLYKKEKNNFVRCLACAHKCLILKDRTGICGVRKNINGKLYLLVYGKIAAMHVDPVEKKPLYHFLPGSFAFSIGTIGCNFKCDFCQNWDISQASKEGKIFGNENEISAEQIVRFAIKYNCKSIAYTYNEPIIFAEYIKDCAKLAHKFKLRNIMVSNGYWSKESFDYLKNYIDAVNIDLKGDEKFYNKFCGGKLKPVLETIKRCNKKGIHIEITTLLIPGENDSIKSRTNIAKFIASVNKNIPWHISRFFPKYKMLDKEITSKISLKKARDIGIKFGLKNVYIGNV
jgi:pyruvate formate lyase activating enzyme